MKVRLNNESINSFLERMHLSKKKIYELKNNKKILASSNNYDLELNEIVEFDLDEESNYKAEKEALDIIYEDEYYLAVNKRRGIIIHDDNNSLANKVSYYFLENNIKSEVRYPSRLDRDTTGVVIFPKNYLCAAYLDFLFSNNEVKKIYNTLVFNRFSNLNGKISLNISTDRHINGKMVTCASGKEAITKYKVLVNNDISFLEINILTGRTHQIRLHMSKIGHPVLGDELYGSDSNHKLMLHCKSIEFMNFDGKRIEIVANLGNDFQDIIKKLK